MTKPVNAPDCYAAASIFSHDSKVCQGCCAFKPCADASMETLMAIKGIVEVSDIIKAHEKAKAQAQKAIARSDAETAAETPPGNLSSPVMTKPVERKTKVVNVSFELSDDESEVIARLPVKPRDIAIRLCTTGKMQSIREDVAVARNPFADGGYAFLRVAFDLLLAGGFSKKTLREAFMRELSWTEGTAMSHGGIACALLLSFGFAQENEGQFTLIPASVT